MKKNIKISVIIPIYNCQKYLPECLQSLSNQSISDFETILVDDGSSDSSLEICETYSLNNDKVKVIHTDNNGVSIARNIGLKNAKGELVVFIDADDVLEYNYLEILSQTIENNDVDLVCCGYKIFPSDTDSVIEDKILCMNASEFVTEVLNNIEIGGYLWNKIFKKALIDEMQLVFPESISIWEDKYFVLKYLIFCKKVRIVDQILYNYRQHGNSAVSVMNYSKLKHKVWVDEHLIKEISFPKSIELLKKEYFRLIIDWGIVGKKSGQLTSSDRKKIIYKIVREKGYKYLNFKRILIFLYLLI